MYPVVTLGKVSRFTVPAMSLALNHDTQSSQEVIVEKEDIEKLSAYTVNSYFVSSRGLIDNITLLNCSTYDKSYLPEHIKSKLFKDYVYYDKKIITIELNNLDSNIYSYDWFRAHHAWFVFQIQLNRNESSSVHKIMLHSHSYESSTANAHGPITSSWRFGFKLHETFLLEYPYSSNCIDYVDPLNVNHSLYSCIHNSHFNLHGKIPNSLMVPASSNYTRMTHDRNIVNYCYNRYGSRPYCDSTDYQLFAIRSFSLLREPSQLNLQTMKRFVNFSPKHFS